MQETAPDLSKTVDLGLAEMLAKKFNESVILSLLDNKMIPAPWRVVSELIYLPVQSNNCAGTPWLSRLANKYKDLTIDDASKVFITGKLTPSQRMYHVIIVPPHLLTDGERRPDKAKKIAEKKLSALYPKDDVQVTNPPMEVVLLLREKLPNHELLNMRLTDIAVQTKEELIDSIEYKKRILSVHNFGNKTRVSAYELEQERDDATAIAFVFEKKPKQQKQNNDQGQQGKKKGNWNNQKPNDKQN